MAAEVAVCAAATATRLDKSPFLRFLQPRDRIGSDPLNAARRKQVSVIAQRHPDIDSGGFAAALVGWASTIIREENENPDSPVDDDPSKSRTESDAASERKKC
ncbi:hypothetical protein MXD62_34960 [Frankia sp. Mgl5]|uniref:hypothetical protein n=1 Tax=Frankia sp. Mgl5 TaxID=2933793 RepID=UPI00200BE9B6|nr:hypothetical protein [Frankia sp. Mgl5]MCK9932284.1 hypothetical protein [Frankia sp. Mgl5]